MKFMAQQPASNPIRGAETGVEPAAREPDRLRLLCELAASLQASQQALLARDVAGLERLTAEQALLGRQIRHSGDARSEAVLAAEKRVLDLGRIQNFLLDRAQRSLRTASNRAAGPHSDYAPARATGSIELRRNPAPAKEA